jgi:predicted small lipoprotein YifL
VSATNMTPGAAVNASSIVGLHQQPQPNQVPLLLHQQPQNSNATSVPSESQTTRNDATSTLPFPVVAPMTQQGLLAATASAAAAPPVGVATGTAAGGGGPLFLPPSHTLAAATSHAVSLPFHGATATASTGASSSSIGMPALAATTTSTLAMNHHHLPFAVSLPQAVLTASEQRLLTPLVFRYTKLRSGKWLREEEAYAELLIDLFEKGHVNDCQNGTTLRSYLSQKLHCAPMRISKKYAGRGIGKMVYLSKVTSAGVGLPFDQQKQIDIMVQTTESKFIKAASPTNEFIRGVSIVRGAIVFARPHVS